MSEREYPPGNSVLASYTKDQRQGIILTVVVTSADWHADWMCCHVSCAFQSTFLNKWLLDCKKHVL